MRNYIIRRLFLLVPIMLGVSFLTFAVFRLIPGDAAILTLGFGSTPESLEDLRHELGIDRPWYEQYGDWVWGVVQGDFGNMDEPLNALTDRDERSKRNRFGDAAVDYRPDLGVADESLPGILFCLTNRQ